MSKEKIIVQSPGRINIIGEHTDYNDGFVMPAAIDKKTVFEIGKNGTASTANFTALNIRESYSFDLTDFKPIKPGWENYVSGVVHELQKLGAKFSGFDCRFEGDVPIGSGMSSSASFECSLAYGLNQLFELGFDDWQLIKACQMAEHNFVGIKCGIMDQFASVKGKKNQVMLLDCRSHDFLYLPFDLKEYQLLLLNTNVSHSLAASEYNTRRSECEEGVEIIKKTHSEIKNLRDVTPEMLTPFAEKMPDNIFRRCRHVVNENERVSEAAGALVHNNFEKLGKLIYESHFSLQDDYEVSCPELDFLVQETLDKEYVLGSRMMGGGFGGCTINLIEKTRVAEFTEITAKNYKNKFGLELTPYIVSVEDGAGEVK